MVPTALLSIAADNFLTGYNMGVVARNAAFVGLVALGQTLGLLVGDIDLSVGATAGLSAIVDSMLLVNLGVHPWLAIPLTMAFGFALGSINGALVAGLGLNPFIVMLATWEIFAGMTLVITGGYPIRPLGEAFQVFGKGEVWSVPVPVILFFAAAAALIWVLSRTRFGRNVFALGGNRDAATLAGIRVRRVEFLCFGLAGTPVALAGILSLPAWTQGSPRWARAAHGRHYRRDPGGTSLRGGQGSIVGTVLGALLLAVLDSGTVMMSVSGDWQRVIVGAVVLVAVLVDLLRPRRA